MNDLHSAHTNQMSNFINKQQMVHLISQRIVDYGCTKYFLNTLYKAAIVTMKRASQKLRLLQQSKQKKDISVLETTPASQFKEDILGRTYSKFREDCLVS